jgi:hypothetical protein
MTLEKQLIKSKDSLRNLSVDGEHQVFQAAINKNSHLLTFWSLRSNMI